MTKAVLAKLVCACLAAMFSFASVHGASAYTIKTLYAFCSEDNCADGWIPWDVTMDQAGVLYGATSAGGLAGEQGYGLIYAYDPAANQYSVLYDFCSQPSCADGANPQPGRMIMDVNGNLYGMTNSGGAHGSGGNDGKGVVFELMRHHHRWREKILYSFCALAGCADGSGPQKTGLTYAGAASGAPYDGTSPLYGTTEGGGANGHGGVFQLKRHGHQWSESVIYSFCAQAGCADGASPSSAPTMDAQGNLYGMLDFGISPPFLDGAIFELTPHHRHWNETILHAFCQQPPNCQDGSSPLGSLTLDAAGNLFGTAQVGGTSNQGVVFKLVPNGANSQYSVLHSFVGQDGAHPDTDLTMDATGNLMGTTFAQGANATGSNGGTVFQLNGSLQTLYDFCSQASCSDGSNPNSGLFMDAAGNLYGTTTNGGPNGRGELYELSP